MYSNEVLTMFIISIDAAIDLKPILPRRRKERGKNKSLAMAHLEKMLEQKRRSTEYLGPYEAGYLGTKNSHTLLCATHTTRQGQRIIKRLTRGRGNRLTTDSSFLRDTTSKNQNHYICRNHWQQNYEQLLIGDTTSKNQNHYICMSHWQRKRK